MATGQGILDRLKKLKGQDNVKPGILPLVAFYGRERAAEQERGRMYRQVAEMMRATDLPDLPEGSGKGGRDGRGANYQYIWTGEKISIADANASPLEYLVSRGEIESDEDIDGMGGARFHTALRFRDVMDGAQVKGLKSPSLEGAGGGTVTASDIRGYQLDCLRIVKTLRDALPAPWAFPLLESLVWRDDWLDVWPDDGKPETRSRKRNERRKTITALHYALDQAGYLMGYLPRQDIMQRWGARAPAAPPAIARRSQASKVTNQLALLTSRGARKG